MSTQAEISGLNLKLHPIERMVFEGFQQRMLEVFKVPSVWVDSTDEILSVKRLFDGKPIHYPYAILTLQSIAMAPDRQNTLATSRRGLVAVISDDKKRGFRVHFLPTDFSVEIKFVANSKADILRLSSEWLFAGRLGWMKFEVLYEKTQFSIGGVLSMSVDIPKRDASLDENPEYIMTVTATVQGFVSHSVLIEQQIATQLDITTYLDTISADSVQWTFSTPPLLPSISTTDVAPNFR